MTTHATTPFRSSAPLCADETILARTSLRARRSTTPDAMAAVAFDSVAGAAAWQPGVHRGTRATPWDWLFPSFFLSMVVGVLPLAGLSWTYPEGRAAWRALEETILLSLPIIVPLPFLLVGCLVALAVQPATRTPAALGFLGIAMIVGAAGIQSVLAIR